VAERFGRGSAFRARRALARVCVGHSLCRPSSSARIEQEGAALGEARSGALLLTAPTLTPDVYALGYASLLDPTFGPRWRDITLRYRAHLRAMGIEEFSHALVCVCAEPLGYTMLLPVNGLRGFNAAALDLHLAALRLASSEDGAMLGAAVRGHPGACWLEERDRPDSSMEPRWRAKFEGVPFPDRGLSEPTWVLLGQLDGAESVGEAVARYAEVCGAAPQEVRTQVLDFVRDSLARGLLVPFQP
jgi:hypothetical protein